MNKKLLTQSLIIAGIAIGALSCKKQEVLSIETKPETEVLPLEQTNEDENTVMATYTPGVSYKYYVQKAGSTTKYLAIEYIAGDVSSRLIISAPHGGLTKPSIMRDRTADYNYGTLPNNQYSNDQSFGNIADSKTKEMATEIANSVRTRTGKRPHLIINHLHRSKLDANRRKEVGAQNGLYAKPAWDKFHAYINAAKATISANHASGLYIDIHGHTHTPQRTEIGYLLTKNQLTNYTNSLGDLTNSSSIKGMVSSSVSHANLIKGTYAFGTLLSNHNNRLGPYPATPSKAYPMPGDQTIFTDGKYFSGGYNNARHGSKFGGKISGFQIEFNQGVRLDDSTRPTYASNVARAIQIYMDQYFSN